MKTNRKTRGKYLLLISVLMLMVLLCACRTRLTNNTEVSATITDEDGLITGTYEMRRADLGIPVAQKPIFTGWGSEEDYDDYSDLSSDSFDYSQTDDGWDEPDDIITADPTGDDTTISGGSTGTGSSTSSTTKKKSQSSSTTKKKTEKTEVTITLNLNDSAGTVNKMTVKKDTVYSSFLPTDVASSDENYVFNGWHTKKSSDSPVNLQDKATKDCTLYAHWKKKEKEPEKKPEEKKEYTVSWEYDNDVTVTDPDKLPKTIKEGETYPDPLPDAHKKDYHFIGWYDGSAMITPGQKCTGNSRLVAKFDSWAKIYNDVNPSQYDDSKKKSFVDEVSNDGSLARGIIWTDNPEETIPGPDFVIIAFDGDEFTPEAAAEQVTRYRNSDYNPEYNPKYDTSRIIVIPKDATSKNNALYYQLLLHNLMYEELDISTAADDTEAASTDYYIEP